jgi:hypothetical protein
MRACAREIFMIQRTPDAWYGHGNGDNVFFFLPQMTRITRMLECKRQSRFHIGVHLEIGFGHWILIRRHSALPLPVVVDPVVDPEQAKRVEGSKRIASKGAKSKELPALRSEASLREVVLDVRRCRLPFLVACAKKFSFKNRYSLV